MSEQALSQLREFANDYDIPIVEDEVLDVLRLLLRIRPPARVLEIGTAIGYASIAFSMCTDAPVVTIEREEAMYYRALQNIRASGLEHRIEVLFGDARDLLPTLKESYDFVFLDAAKAQYADLLHRILPLVPPGGIICCDDVLYHGMVEDRSLLDRRMITIVKRMKKFLEEIRTIEGFETTLIRAGDGLVVLRRENA